MKRIPWYFQFLGGIYITIFLAEVLEARQDISCQQKSTSGRSYLGEVNTTVDGIPCQKWSDTKPHDHEFSHVGEHNFCRNPYGSSHSQVWCFTTDPEIPYQNCSVPFCPPLRALDFKNKGFCQQKVIKVQNLKSQQTCASKGYFARSKAH